MTFAWRRPRSLAHFSSAPRSLRPGHARPSPAKPRRHPRPRALAGDIAVRRDLRDGDRDAIVALHQRIYPDGYGVAQSFVDDVAAALDGVIARGWPDRLGDGVWIVERAGEPCGCLALSDEGDGEGRVRFFLLAQELRGRGVGRRMLDELMDVARGAGYRRLVLATFDELTIAAHLYRSRGFRLVRSERGPRWGREDFNYQHYELEL